MAFDDYVTITGVLKRINPRSFIVINPEGSEVVIGRSCVHFADEQRLSQDDIDEEVEIRVVEWLAEKENFI